RVCGSGLLTLYPRGAARAGRNRAGRIRAGLDQRSGKQIRRLWGYPPMIWRGCATFCLNNAPAAPASDKPAARRAFFAETRAFRCPAFADMIRTRVEIGRASCRERATARVV